MRQKFIKSLVAVASLAFAFSLMVVPVQFANAATSAAPSGAGTLDPWGGKAGDLGSATGLGNKDPRDIIAGVINTVLGFLGVVAVCIILLGGFKYMTAAGEQAKVDEAKKLIISGIIGLVIILSAFGIATFVIGQLVTTTTG
ncbi:MAG: pilin [Candidatus Falkowbacteria bacterium]|nr:pilin [Candidatus Falkowbacteria bacterium]